jgi:hypothetical protein
MSYKRKTLGSADGTAFIAPQNVLLNYFIVAMVFVIILYTIANYPKILAMLNRGTGGGTATPPTPPVPPITPTTPTTPTASRRNVPFTPSTGVGVSTNGYVLPLQQQLYRVGFNITADDAYGNSTDGALREYYRLKGQSFPTTATTQDHYNEVRTSGYL